jgi:hypothetical protein
MVKRQQHDVRAQPGDVVRAASAPSVTHGDSEYPAVNRCCATTPKSKPSASAREQTSNARPSGSLACGSGAAGTLKPNFMSRGKDLDRTFRTRAGASAGLLFEAWGHQCLAVGAVAALVKIVDVRGDGVAPSVA